MSNATVLLGLVTPAGRVAYLSPAVPADPSLLDQLEDGEGSPESRYRFAGPCVEGNCAFWGADHCTLAAELADGAGDSPVGRELPKCSIRPRCRWFAERGAGACEICPLVITDRTGKGMPSSK